MYACIFVHYAQNVAQRRRPMNFIFSCSGLTEGADTV